jgi:hypothetical protein
MRAEILLKEFLIALSLLSLSGFTISGKLQQFIPFNSVEGEIALAVVSATFGLLFLTTSIKIKR